MISLGTLVVESASDDETDHWITQLAPVRPALDGSASEANDTFEKAGHVDTTGICALCLDVFCYRRLVTHILRYLRHGTVANSPNPGWRSFHPLFTLHPATPQEVSTRCDSFIFPLFVKGLSPKYARGWSSIWAPCDRGPAPDRAEGIEGDRKRGTTSV